MYKRQGRVPAEGSAVGVRGDPDGGVHALAQRLTRAETGPAGHHLHRQIRGLQQLPGQVEPASGQPLGRAGAGLLPEPAGERAHAHPRTAGQLVQAQRLSQVLQGPGTAGGGARPGGFRHRPVDVLRLPAVPPRRHHAGAGRPVGDLAAVVAADHVQAQVDAGRRAGRGEDAVVDEQHVRVETDPREQAVEAVRPGPVRGRPAAVEQAGGGQDERAGADRHDPGASPVGRDQGLDQLRRRAAVGQHRTAARRRDDHGIGVAEQVDAVIREQAEPGAGGHGTTVEGAGAHLVQRNLLLICRRVEEAGGDAEVEGIHVVHGQNRYPMTHGPILAFVVRQATSEHAAARRR